MCVYIGCVDSICSSDHKPVFSSFDVGIVTQFTSSHGGSVLTADMKIIFHEISVEVVDQSQEFFLTDCRYVIVAEGVIWTNLPATL